MSGFVLVGSACVVTTLTCLLTITSHAAAGNVLLRTSLSGVVSGMADRNMNHRKKERKRKEKEGQNGGEEQHKYRPAVIKV